MLDADELPVEPPDPDDAAAEASGFPPSDAGPAALAPESFDPDAAGALPSPASVFVADGDVDVALRSFFAQPEPLKWIAGGTNAFRTFVE